MADRSGLPTVRKQFSSRLARADGQMRSQVLPQQVIDLHQLYRRSVHFNEGDQHPSARTVGINDHLPIPDRLRQVIAFESNVWNGLHQVWMRRAVPYLCH
jgi:hypothetical protein